MEVTSDRQEIIARIAALDIGKSKLMCCVRVPGPGPATTDGHPQTERMQEVRRYSTSASSLAGMVGWLADLDVTRVVIDAGSDYWKPPFHLLEAAGFDVRLVDAREVKHLPGRPPSDELDLAWLCKVAERQMIRPLARPARPIRILRDLTRYRWGLVTARKSEHHRAERLLDDAEITLPRLVLDSFGARGSFGVAARDVMNALIAGQRDPRVLADLVRSSLPKKTHDLQQALTGRFDDHHAFLLAKILARIDGLSVDIAEVEARLQVTAGPFASVVRRFTEIPGVDTASAQSLIAEIGLDPARFPAPADLLSWASAPAGGDDSADAAAKKGPRGTDEDNRHLALLLDEIALAGSGTHTFLGERYRRIAHRRGPKHATAAAGRSVLTIVWYLLNDDEASVHDLGPGFYDTLPDTARKTRDHVRELQALGYKVVLEPVV